MPKIFALTHCDASGTLLVVSADSSSMWHCGYDYTVRDATVEFPVGFSTQQDTFMVRGTYDCLPSAMRGLQLELGLAGALGLDLEHEARLAAVLELGAGAAR